VEWVSSAAFKTNLRKLLELTNLVLDRCEKTLLHTPRVLRYWLRSWCFSFFPYPFELPQQRQTQQRYHLYFHRFLYYIFHIHQLCHKLKQSIYKIYGLYLSKPQIQIMDYIWTEISNLTRASVETPTPIAVLEAIF
jgi:hypothetical protein